MINKNKTSCNCFTILLIILLLLIFLRFEFLVYLQHLRQWYILAHKIVSNFHVQGYTTFFVFTIFIYCCRFTKVRMPCLSLTPQVHVVVYPCSLERFKLYLFLPFFAIVTLCLCYYGFFF